MSPEMQQKWDAHIYQMEKCSFLLDVIRAHINVITTTDAHSGSMLDACVILGGVSPQYCDFILKMRDKFPNHDLEMLSQEIYDMIFCLDYKSTAKFQAFFETPLNQWYDLRKKQRQLFSEKNVLDGILSDAKHAYYSVYGKDIEWKEIEQKRQETEPEIETSNIGYTQKKEHQMELVARLVKDNVITIETAFEYMNNRNDFDDFDNFLRVLDVWMEKQEVKKDDEQ